MSKPAISAAVIVRDHKVLLVKRRVKEGTLSWQFPAGGVEDGETPVEAAIRETKEETTLSASEVKTLGDRVHPNTGRQMHYIACDAPTGSAAIGDEDELAAVAWATLGELAEYVPHGFFEPVQTYLDEALRVPEPVER